MQILRPGPQGIWFLQIKKRDSFFLQRVSCVYVLRNLCSFVLGQATDLSKERTFLVLLANIPVVWLVWSHSLD